MSRKIITKLFLKKYGYETVSTTPNYLTVISNILFLPLQLIVALFFNLNRMDRVADNITRRLT